MDRSWIDFWIDSTDPAYLREFCHLKGDVAKIYEVGEHHGQLFLAMEYVAGKNLRQWLLQEKRTWQETIALLIEVGRGLQAAHAIGLVHRDVKPDNILVGEDGRARIADFGLVRAVDTVDPAADDHTGVPGLEASASTPGSGSQRAWGTGLLTQEGRALGTPAYMSPEQHVGGEVDPRSDQFSLCVSLYEALYEKRPFSGHDVKSIRAQALAGSLRPTPATTSVPRWIDRAIRRGLATVADERWPSIDALLYALSHDPSRRWRWAGAITLGLGLLAGGTYALASHQAQAANRCAGAAKELAEIWDEPRREALQAAFMATGDPLAAETIPRVERLLDTYSELWINEHRNTCEAHLGGATSALLLDLTMDCLRRRKGELAALVEVLLEGEAGTVENAVLAASNLPTLNACASAESLLATTPLPDDQAQVQEIEQLRRDLDRAFALEAAGRYEDGLRLLGELMPRVEALAYPPLTAEATLRRGSLAMWLSKFTTATSLLHQAFVTGLASKSDRVAIEALSKWIYSMGYGLGHPNEAIFWHPTALALVDRLDDAEDLRALTLHNMATAISTSGHLQEAIDIELEALALLDDGEVLTMVVLSNISESRLELRQCAKSEEASQRAQSISAKVLSRKHPLTRVLELNHCAVYACRGSYAKAMQCWERGLLDTSGRQRELSPHVASVFLASTGNLALDHGDYERASADLQRALSTFKPRSEPRHVTNIADGLGWLALAEPDLDRAAGYFKRSLDIHERLETPQETRLNTLAGLAAIDLAQGHAKEARARLEAPLTAANPMTSEQPWTFARARYTLARALATSHNLEDRRRAQTLARLARESLTIGHFEDGLRQQIEAWLDDYDPNAPPPEEEAETPASTDDAQTTHHR